MAEAEEAAAPPEREPSKQEVEAAIIQQFQKLKQEKNDFSAKIAEINRLMRDVSRDEVAVVG